MGRCKRFHSSLQPRPDPNAAVADLQLLVVLVVCATHTLGAPAVVLQEGLIFVVQAHLANKNTLSEH